jgi:hypothetical protein
LKNKIKKIKVKESRSIISFETTGGGQWDVWDRFIAIDGKKAYHIGNICGTTCSFFFERLDGANRKMSAEILREQFKDGSIEINDRLIEQMSLIIPNGEYFVAVLEVSAKQIELGKESDYFSHEQVDEWGIDGFWEMPFNPKIKYYRGVTKSLNEREGLFEFIVPMFPQGWLEDDTVAGYKNLLASDKSPVALALSILDIKEPYNSYEIDGVSKHWCLTHYLIDGYHKTFTASQSNKPIRLLSFLAIDQGISNKEEIEELVSILEEGTDIR